MNISTVVTAKPDRGERLWAAYLRIFPVLLAEEENAFKPDAVRFCDTSARAWSAACTACGEFDWRAEAIAAFNAEVGQ